MIYKTGLSESDIEAMEGCIARYKKSADAVKRAQKLAGLVCSDSKNNPLWIRLSNHSEDGVEVMLDEQLREDLRVAFGGFLARKAERLKELKLVLGQGEGEAE
jgi:hypothetical protein